jgi:hypothetical protein
MPADQI